VDNMPAPSSRTPAILAALLLHTRRLVRDASTMPALGSYINDFHEQLDDVHSKARALRRAAASFEAAFSTMTAAYTSRNRLPPYYHKLLDAYEAVVQSTFDP